MQRLNQVGKGSSQPGSVAFGRILASTLLFALLASGCSTKSSPPPPESSPPESSPTAFFDWCRSEGFGVKSPTNAAFHNSGNASSGQLGLIKYSAWIPSKTEQEAQEFLVSTFKALRKQAEEAGCEPERDVEPLPGKGLALKYRRGGVQGTLDGQYELRDTPDGGKITKAYWVNLNLVEEVSPPAGK